MNCIFLSVCDIYLSFNVNFFYSRGYLDVNKLIFDVLFWIYIFEKVYIYGKMFCFKINNIRFLYKIMEFK